MGLFSRLLKVSAAGTVASVGVFWGATRNDVFEPMDTSDPIFQSAFFKKFNPNRNPTLHDVCVRRIPLDKIKPELLENKGKLVEAFCAGVWGGMGYIPQRAYLDQKYRGPETADHLWKRSDLLSSNYEVGTLITDHFEVVEKTEDRITVRCGASPRIRDVRPSDGLFEIGAVVKQEQGVAEFSLKSCFYQGLGKAEAAPMDDKVAWAHRQYTKLLLETAVLKKCVR
ncbi:hypothetical protein N7499_004001 [Penicillium canescens]|uniref:Uncharacterized protein n=1 Tax=Penicillium canescens TaxID=5083 RepID=A0AAD6ILP8_PENCN|nr:uncharacterized protein N7446_007512 [Penicillium canescens]KAJ5991585.1 hypothetical protein N7522_011792 [Penicillium canescens]KAJ6049161.1 hypothetical protein N7444_005877 [Penicillium canescens]KAJ6052867.1 hypothetical protein N7460_003401 [Penicillium canescens]KAJ6063392.1 hypothetical protein N7446_007512 [Penicillium canescens]KAJ6089154.1 hypothetical protein N7499_004001 [Penicillium canescens]